MIVIKYSDGRKLNNKRQLDYKQLVKCWSQNIIIEMNDQKLETVCVAPQKIDSDLVQDGVEDPEKHVDLPDTNPTIDDEVESDGDEGAIVCYNFSAKARSEEKSDEDPLGNSGDNEQQSPEESPMEESMEKEKEKEKEIAPVVLQELQEDDLPDIPVRNRKESLEIITAALNERKLSNLENYNGFVTKRSSYYEEFTGCLLKIQEEGLRNLNETESFGKELVKALKEVRQAYRNFSRDLSKVSFGVLEGNDSSLWGRIVPNGFKLISEYKDTCSDAARVFYEWLDSQCIVKIQEVFLEAKQKVEAQYKDVKKSRESCSTLNNKSLIIPKEAKVKDLLCEQLKFNKLMQEQNNKAQEWGAAASRLLETILTKDSEILCMLKFEMASLIGHLKMTGRQSHHLFQAENYWIGIPSDQETMFNRIMNEWKVCSRSKGFPQGDDIKMQEIHKYLILSNEDEHIGNLKSVLRQLQINTYKMALDFDRNDWRSVEAYFSVDNHLIFVDEQSSVRNCMNIVEIEYEINDLELKVKEREKGLFTTWNREKIRFKSSNEMEEFLILIDSMKDLRLQS